MTGTPHLLQVVASPRGERSESRRVSDVVVRRFVELHPATVVDVLDLWDDLTPVFDPSFVDAKMAVIFGQDRQGQAAEAWSHIEAAARRLLAADHLIIATPVWNGGVPWILKRWIDTVTQPGLLCPSERRARSRHLATSSSTLNGLCQVVVPPVVRPRTHRRPRRGR